MNPSARPEFQLFFMLLVVIEAAAAIMGNDVLLVLALVLILVVALQWYRFWRGGSRREGSAPDWLREITKGL